MFVINEVGNNYLVGIAGVFSRPHIVCKVYEGACLLELLNKDCSVREEGLFNVGRHCRMRFAKDIFDGVVIDR